MTSGVERRVRRLLERADIQVGGTRAWDVQVLNDRFYARLARDGALGAGESYTDGWWECPRLDQLTERALRAGLPAQIGGRWFQRFWGVCRRWFGPRPDGRTVAAMHYDREPEFFAAWLGPTMNYSCGYWRSAADLDQAQRDKMELIAAKLHVTPGCRVLDIGCGWGGLARYLAARHKCHVVGVTPASQQADFARRACAGLPVEILTCDYRDPQIGRAGPFDRVASVGMFEHVGRRHQRTFLTVCRTLLKPDGLVMLHTMGRTTPGDFDAWTDRYLFPDSYIPTVADLAGAVWGQFVIEDWHNFGADYDRTLMAWHERFEKWAGSQAPPCDPRFYRMWRYYLLTYAGYFRARSRAQLWQLVLSPAGVSGGYRSVRDVCSEERP